jgi:hypothetical protein
MVKKLVFFLVIVPAFIFVVLTWDYYLSKFLFARYCNSSLVGLFIYEQVELDDKYFKPIPKDVDRLLLDRRFILDEDRIIDRTVFDEDYEFFVYDATRLSTVGPISAIETSVVRKSDRKVLGKAVSLVNSLGWWTDSSGFGNKTDTCPNGRDSFHVPNFFKDHNALVGQVFYSETGKGDAQ